MSTRCDDPHFVARLRAASDPVLLARIDQAVEIVRLVRAGRACHADLTLEIRAAFRRGDRAYGIQLARDTGRIDEFINGRFTDELAEDDSNQKETT